VWKILEYAACDENNEGVNCQALLQPYVALSAVPSTVRLRCSNTRRNKPSFKIFLYQLLARAASTETHNRIKHPPLTMKLTTLVAVILVVLHPAGAVDGGKACRFFVWDVNQALRHRTCSRLQAENTYLGRDGKSFVHIHHNSPLVRLWPCERHLPNACVICGHPRSEHDIFFPGLGFLLKRRDQHAAWKRRRRDDALASPFSTFVSRTAIGGEPKRRSGKGEKGAVLRDLTCRQIVSDQIASGRFNVTNPEGESLLVKAAMANGAMTMILSDGETKERIKRALAVELPR
jgi:hypothetical protein